MSNRIDFLPIKYSILSRLVQKSGLCLAHGATGLLNDLQITSNLNKWHYLSSLGRGVRK